MVKGFSSTEQVIQDNVDAVSGQLTNQVLNDHPDVQTIVPSFPYSQIAVEFPPDTWLKPEDLTFNVSWTDTGANPIATIHDWGSGSTADVTTYGSYPAVRLATASAGNLAIGLNANKAGADWSKVFHIERMTDVGSFSARVNGVSNVSLTPIDNLFSVNTIFGFIAGTTPNAGKTQSWYYNNGAIGLFGPLPINYDPLATSMGTSIIWRWVDSTKMLTCVDCNSGSYVSVNLPSTAFATLNAIFFGGETADGSGQAMTVTDIAWWDRALTDDEIWKLSSAYCMRYMTPTPCGGR